MQFKCDSKEDIAQIKQCSQIGHIVASVGDGGLTESVFFFVHAKWYDLLCITYITDGNLCIVNNGYPLNVLNNEKLYEVTFFFVCNITEFCGT